MRTEHRLPLGILFLVLVTTAVGQQLRPIAWKVEQARAKGLAFQQMSELITPVNGPARTATTEQGVERARYFQYNREVARQLLSYPPGTTLSLSFPPQGRSQQKMTLDLVEVPSSFYNYKVSTSSGETYQGDPSRGRHYRGVVRGEENNSLATLSFFEEEMSGMISVGGTGNFSLRRVDDGPYHMMYNDRNLADRPSSRCSTPDSPEEFDEQISNHLQNTTRNSSQRSGASYGPIFVYFETEFDMFQNLGQSVQNVENYIANVYNQVAAIYANDQMDLRISEIKVWNTEDPYIFPYDSINGSHREQFMWQTDHINGDIGHLMTFSYRGGQANTNGNGLCEQNVDKRLSVGGINPPNDIGYAIYVVAHEIGHTLGSPHTHDCVWGNGSEQIDDCGNQEFVTNNFDDDGDGVVDELDEATFCYDPNNVKLPGAAGGTIMSYCFDPVNGFGPEPGDLIRGLLAQCNDYSRGSYTGVNDDTYVINKDNTNVWSTLRLQTAKYRAWHVVNGHDGLSFRFIPNGDHTDWLNKYEKMGLRENGWLYIGSKEMRPRAAIQFEPWDDFHRIAFHKLTFWDLDTGGDMMTLENDNVGIGTTNPGSRLQIASPANGRGLEINSPTAGNTHFPWVDNWNYISGNGVVFRNANDQEKMRIDMTTGNVGIGTFDPGSYKLAVNGHIRAKEVVVETGWSDFVFEEVYELPSLEEVECHIQEMGHLKDIPSAAEVAENGVSLGKMDAKLLQKIEELTLYTIARQHRIDSLRRRNQHLHALAQTLNNLQEKMGSLEGNEQIR